MVPLNAMQCYFIQGVIDSQKNDMVPAESSLQKIKLSKAPKSSSIIFTKSVESSKSLKVYCCHLCQTETEKSSIAPKCQRKHWHKATYPHWIQVLVDSWVIRWLFFCKIFFCDIFRCWRLSLNHPMTPQSLHPWRNIPPSMGISSRWSSSWGIGSRWLGPHLIQWRIYIV